MSTEQPSTVVPVLPVRRPSGSEKALKPLKPLKVKNRRGSSDRRDKKSRGNRSGSGADNSTSQASDEKVNTGAASFLSAANTMELPTKGEAATEGAHASKQTGLFSDDYEGHNIHTHIQPIYYRVFLYS